MTQALFLKFKENPNETAWPQTLLVYILIHYIKSKKVYKTKQVNTGHILANHLYQ